MIKVEYLNDGTLVKHYSDSGMAIRQVETGETYGEAIDAVPCQYTYEEVEPENESDTDAEQPVE